MAMVRTHGIVDIGKLIFAKLEGLLRVAAQNGFAPQASSMALVRQGKSRRVEETIALRSH
jgi:hypothetical protein